MKILVFMGCNMILPFIIGVIALVFLTSTHEWRQAAKKYFLPVLNLIFPTNPKFRKFIWLKKFLPKPQSTVTLEAPEQLKHLKGISGKPLVYPIECEQELYFRQLNRDWA